jgi:hypothetical protein
VSAAVVIKAGCEGFQHSSVVVTSLELVVLTTHNFVAAAGFLIVFLLLLEGRLQQGAGMRSWGENQG